MAPKKGKKGSKKGSKKKDKSEAEGEEIPEITVLDKNYYMTQIQVTRFGIQKTISFPICNVAFRLWNEL